MNTSIDPPANIGVATTTDVPANAASNTANTSPTVDVNDLNDWVDRINTALERPTKVAAEVNTKSVADQWHNSLFGCCSPFSLCALTSCCPSITFGKTYYREKKDSSMKDYHPINMTCLLFCIGSHFACIPLLFAAMQRGDLRRKYNLAGSTAGDLAKGCCCICCNIIQTEKESAYRASLAQNGNVVEEQPGRQVEMMAYAPLPEPPQSVVPRENVDRAQEAEQGTVRRGSAPAAAV